MDITIVIKIASVGILVAILNSILVRSGRDEYAMITILAGVVVVLMMLVPHFSQLLDTVKTIVEF